MAKQRPGTGTKDDPWHLKTPPGTSEYTMYRDDSFDPPYVEIDQTWLVGELG